MGAFDGWSSCCTSILRNANGTFFWSLNFSMSQGRNYEGGGGSREDVIC